MVDVVIVHAREEDVEGIQRVASEGWRATYRMIYDGGYISQFLERNYPTDGLRRSIQSGRSVFLVARHDQQDEWCMVKRIAPAT